MTISQTLWVLLSICDSIHPLCESISSIFEKIRTAFMAFKWSATLFKSKILIYILNIGREIDSSKHVASTVNGQREEVSSTTMPRPSSSGLMKKINSVLFPCRMEQISTLFSKDFQELLLQLKKLPSSQEMTTLDTLPHAQLTLELHSELQSISDFPSSLRSGMSSKPSLISTTFRSEVFTESTPNQLMLPTTSPTSADSVVPRDNSFRTCTTVLKPWLKRKSHSEQTSNLMKLPLF